MEKEIRTLQPTLTIEKREGGDGAVITGYAIVYNKDSEYIGFIERVNPGAATKALKKSDVRVLIDHVPSNIVGRTGQNLELREDKDGVFIEVSRPKRHSPRFDQLESDIENGFINKQSFTFTIAKGGAYWNADFTERTITEFDEIFDVSLVTYPAYPDTTVALRSKDAAQTEKRTKPIEIEVGGSVFSFSDEKQAEEVSKKIVGMLPGPKTNERHVEIEPSPKTAPPTKADDDRFLSIKTKLIKKGIIK